MSGGPETAEMENALVRTDNVSYRLAGNTILENINLSVSPGDFIGIIGPNGAGKTTLLRLLLGLARPTAGMVKVLGVSPASLGHKRQLIGYMPQRPLVSRNFPLSALDVVEMGLTSAATLGCPPGKYRSQKARESLDRVGMLFACHFPFAHLSGGQQQRVFLARALVKNPSLLFLDEPNSGLDLPTQNSFMAVLKALQTEKELTVVMVSHDLAAVAAHAGRLFCINRTMHVHGSPKEVLGSPLLSKAYRCEFELLFGRERSPAD